MEDLNSVNKRAHKMVLSNRRTCNLTGVCDVLSFDVNEIILETDLGMLMIKGNELHVNRLTLEKGEVDVEGRIDSFTYSEQLGTAAKGESLLTRLFR
ncbi:MAG: sporulation protein YabP [Lachnospiraceae bacterium]|nr:sporulation protein YabP [Lachnospiraceae bacterium]